MKIEINIALILWNVGNYLHKNTVWYPRKWILSMSSFHLFVCCRVWDIFAPANGTALGINAVTLTTSLTIYAVLWAVSICVSSDISISVYTKSYFAVTWVWSIQPSCHSSFWIILWHVGVIATLLLCRFMMPVKGKMVYRSICCKSGEVCPMCNSRQVWNGFTKTYFLVTSLWCVVGKQVITVWIELQLHRVTYSGGFFSVWTFYNNKIIYEG